MESMRYVKEVVLQCSNTEIARITGVSRMTVKKWLDGAFTPNFEYIMKLRAEIIRRKLDWNDTYWFDPPHKGD